MNDIHNRYAFFARVYEDIPKAFPRHKEIKPKWHIVILRFIWLITPLTLSVTWATTFFIIMIIAADPRLYNIDLLGGIINGVAIYISWLKVSDGYHRIFQGTWIIDDTGENNG